MIWLCMSVTDGNGILNSLSRKMSLYIDCLDTNVENLFSKLASLAGALRSFGGACCGLASFAFALISWLSRYSSRSSRSSRSSMLVNKFGSSIFVIPSMQRTHIDSSQFGQRGKISIELSQNGKSHFPSLISNLWRDDFPRSQGMFQLSSPVSINKL